MTWLALEHRMHFQYDGWVHASRMELRVQPATDERQTLHEFSLAVGPPARIRRYTDWLDHSVHYFQVPAYHDRLEVVARSLVHTHPPARDGLGAPALPAPPPSLGPLQEWVGFDGPVVRSERLEALSRALAVPADAPVGAQVAAVGRVLLERFRYEPGTTHVGSSTEDLLDAGAGVCQDFAHLALGLLRLRAIPCRYVSGYLHVAADEPAQSHGWIEVHAPGIGWWSFDPTHGHGADERYVVVASGRSYEDVPPSRGVFRGHARETLVAEVRTRQVETPGRATGLREEYGQIDVPEHREPPSREARPQEARSHEAAPPGPGEAAQQQ